MNCSARIVVSVPDLDAKFYASTQTMDEARHAETYARLDMAGIDLGSLMRADEDQAEAIDAEKRELAMRRRQVAETIEAGERVG